MRFLAASRASSWCRGGRVSCRQPHHLQDGEVALPPEVFAHRRPHGGELVVGVHHSVHQ